MSKVSEACKWIAYVIVRGCGTGGRNKIKWKFALVAIIAPDCTAG